MSFVPIDEEFSVGQFAELAHREIDALLDEGRTPIVVGGTGLYLRAALTELDLRPPPEPDLRERLERELAEVGPGGAARAAVARDRRAPCTRTTASGSCARWSSSGWATQPHTALRPALVGRAAAARRRCSAS